MLYVAAVATVVPLLARLSLPRQEAVLLPRRRRALDAARADWLAANVDRVLAMSHPVVRTGCLTRGLTYFYFLRRAGVDVRLSYGLGEIEGKVEGHCWIVRDGEPFLERQDPRELYTETYSIPRARV
jgi:Transglutaminase-like superfamily